VEQESHVADPPLRAAPRDCRSRGPASTPMRSYLMPALSLGAESIGYVNQATSSILGRGTRPDQANPALPDGLAHAGSLQTEFLEALGGDG
jgi:hypothetical protein